MAQEPVDIASVRESPGLVPQPVGRANGEARWLVDFFGGWMGLSAISAGDGRLPVPGREYLSLLQLPSREVPSWYFGDGAQFLNEMAPQLEAFAGLDLPEMVPLDPVLTQPALRRRSGLRVGGRLTRMLGQRYSLEIEATVSSTGWEFTQEALAAIEASRAGFEHFWKAFAELVPHDVSSRTAAARGSGRQTMITGAVVRTFESIHGLAPYVVGGAGGTWNSGRAPSVRLSGRYQFVLGIAPFEERDEAHVRFDVPDRTLVGLVGGGLERMVSDRMGFRVDARWHLSRERTRTLLDTTSSRILQQGENTGGVTTPTVPSLIINNRAVGPTPPSSLSAPPLRGFETLSSGLHVQFSLTAGVVFGF